MWVYPRFIICVSVALFMICVLSHCFIFFVCRLLLELNRRICEKYGIKVKGVVLHKAGGYVSIIGVFVLLSMICVTWYVLLLLLIVLCVHCY